MEQLPPHPVVVGRQEIAGRLGVAPRTVDSWRRRHGDFPAPSYVVNGHPAWEWRKVERWHRGHQARLAKRLGL